MTTPATIADFDDFLCRDCGHTAKRHFTHSGPCSECWALAKTICKAFGPKVEDEEAIDALIARIEPEKFRDITDDMSREEYNRQHTNEPVDRVEE